MVERFADAALRHLETAEVLEQEGRLDDAAYHYGLVAETALKEACVRATGMPLDKKLRRHINDKKNPLQAAISNYTQITTMMHSGRLGGALGYELSNGSLVRRFVSWSIDIRYADDAHCPVKLADLAMWKADALALYNNGVF